MCVNGCTHFPARCACVCGVTSAEEVLSAGPQPSCPGLSAVSGGGHWSQSSSNWCQAGCSEKPSVSRDAQPDRKPFIRGLPPTAGLCVSLSVPLSLPISLPLKISHHSPVSICSLPLPLTLSWFQTLTIYHSASTLDALSLCPSVPLCLCYCFYVYYASLGD